MSSSDKSLRRADSWIRFCNSFAKSRSASAQAELPEMVRNYFGMLEPDDRLIYYQTARDLILFVAMWWTPAPLSAALRSRLSVD